MKNAIFLHGVGDTPDSVWFPYLRAALEKKGYEVYAPHLPEADHPTVPVQAPFVLKNAKFSEDTIIVAHSAGCPLALSVLERVEGRIRQAILVAGFVFPLLVEGAPNSILQDTYQWSEIKKHVRDIIFIHSDNDPWGCDDRQGRMLFDNLGGTLIIRHGEGHMGSERFGQAYKEFPFLLKLID